jgi:hypothetical protein
MEIRESVESMDRSCCKIVFPHLSWQFNSKIKKKTFLTIFITLVLHKLPTLFYAYLEANDELFPMVYHNIKLVMVLFEADLFKL